MKNLSIINSADEIIVFRLGEDSVVGDTASASCHASRLDANDGQPLVAAEALLAQQPALQQGRAQAEPVV